MGRGRQLKRRVQVHYCSCFWVIASPLLAKAGAQVYFHIFPSLVLIVVCISVSFLLSLYACMYLGVLFCLLLWYVCLYLILILILMFVNFIYIYIFPLLFLGNR